MRDDVINDDDDFSDMASDDDFDDDWNSDSWDRVRSSRNRSKGKDQMRHEERMAKMRANHDVRMAKIRAKEERDLEASESNAEARQSKAQRYIAKTKAKQEKAKNASKVKLIAKLAVAAEVLKYMMDHHADEEGKLKTKEKIELHKAGIGSGSASSKQKAVKASKILKSNGIALEPKDVQDIYNHTNNMSSSSFNNLLTKIEGWIKDLRINVSPHEKSGSITDNGYGVLW